MISILHEVHAAVFSLTEGIMELKANISLKHAKVNNKG